MPINVTMPALSPTMTEGTLAKWHVKEGDEVNAGDVIAEIETDKATMEVEAVDEGRVGRIVVDEGTEGVAVNAVIAVLLGEDEDESALEKAVAKAEKPKEPEKAETADKPKEAETPKAEKKAPAEQKAKTAETVSPEPSGAPSPVTTGATQPPPPAEGKGERVFVSPLAKRMAQQAGLDLAALRGSGPHGRIVKRDIESALAGEVPTAAPAAAAPLAAGPSAKELADAFGMDYRQEKLSSMRRTIARRLSEAKQTVPHFYLTIDCEIDELLRVRKELNERFEGLKVSVNDFVIRASALALMQVPAANASWDESGVLFYEHADISVAVATPNGLITPIVKRAEQKGLSAISKEMKDMAGRAREGKLKPEEYQGGTFSVSNLGMYGIRDFAAIINPPQGCILAVGAGEQRPVVKNGALAIASVMSCTLAVDHRVVDGAIGAEFLAAFKKLVEYPAAMLL